MALDKQIQILSVDTGNFYYDDEAKLHERNRYVRTERRKLMNGYDEKDEETTIHHKGTTEILKELQTLGYSEKDVKTICNGDDLTFSDYDKNTQELLLLYYETQEQVIAYANEARSTKDELLNLLQDRVNYNIAQTDDNTRQIRTLKEETLLDKDGNLKDDNVISVFDSSFTRMIGAAQDTLSEDFMVVQVYYFDVIKDLIYHGFYYKGEKYIYFTSSAGQIRTKKTVFVKEAIWNKYEKTIMCGLTLDAINDKGGNNPNKHLAYMALLNSATDVWKEFDIDKTIVIDDFETQVFGTYDLVDDTDYSIKRISDYVPITHTDGAGMMLPCMGKNRMVRLPWVKGLLGAFDFVKFIEVNNCSPIIKDIYGQEHNVIEEDIQIIFTKSQFKMYKYYDSWNQYKEYYKKYQCTAGYTNMEEDIIGNATINYQMLQSLTDITDEEILEIADESINRIKNISSSVEDIKRAFGATVYNTDKTFFQKSICIYPELLNDVYVRNKLKEIKDSMIKKYKSGKLRLESKYTFLLPDYYAACQYWFQHIDNPTGLLKDGEVFCWLFKNDEELDCLRSPHLYMEHAIRKNLACNHFKEKQIELREWFDTNAIYTSCFDMISKVLQFDCDGDKSLVVANKTIINVAKRNLKKFDIVPLYYNMRKANPSILGNETIYNGLSSAFTGSNIGQYSNSITKIWNSDVFVNGTLEEQKEALLVIKLLCMENNFRIDFAKTLYMPERPEFAKTLITQYTKNKVPYFFTFAKDKELSQVEEINNSFVNKLNSIIPNTRISCKYVDADGIKKKLMRPISMLMMNDANFEIEERHLPIINTYLEYSRKFYFKIDVMSIKNMSAEILKNSQLRENLMFSQIVTEVKTSLLSLGFSEIEITDVLIKYLYDEKESKYKDMLWVCFGETIYNNLSTHSKVKAYGHKFISAIKPRQCIECGKWFEVEPKNNSTIRCPKCQSIAKRELAKLRKRKQREREKMSLLDN